MNFKNILKKNKFIKIKNSTELPILVFISEEFNKLQLSEIKFENDVCLSFHSAFDIRWYSKNKQNTLKKIIVPSNKRKNVNIENNIIYLTVCQKKDDYYDIIFINKEFSANSSIEINNLDLICPVTKVNNISIDF